jgi:hypothetical protein
MLTCGWLFSWVYQVPPIIWRTPADMMQFPNMVVSYGGNLLISLIFVLVFGWIYKGLPGKGAKKGLAYGFMVWLVGTLSGIALMPSYMTIATTVVVYWLIQLLVISLINGAIVGAIYKK